MPDTVWGPAWVAWRGNDAAVGWAPLPPGAVFEAGVGFSFRGHRVNAEFAFNLSAGEFTFVEFAHFCEPALNRHRLPRAEATRVYTTTTIFQNNYAMVDNRVVNHGPPVDRIAGPMQREIRQLRIFDRPTPGGRSPQAGGFDKATVSVFRPHVTFTAHETPVAVAARARVLVVTRRAAGTPPPALRDYGSGATVHSFSERGLSSRGTAGGGIVRTPPPPASGSSATAERNRTDLERRAQESQQRQRQAEEAAARQQQDAQRRTQEARQQQDEQRRALQAQRQAEEATARQRQVEEAAGRLQQDAQRRAQEAQPRQDEQRRAQQSVQTPPNAIQDYDNGNLTGAASARGAVSRDKANRGGRGGN